MSEPSSRRRLRPWRVIAEELQKETDVHRLLELSRELSEALDEQTGNLNRDGQR